MRLLAVRGRAQGSALPVRRHRLRTRLALLYGGLFLASGLVLLGITVGLWQHRTGGSVSSAVPTGAGQPPGPGAVPVGPGSGASASQHGTDAHQLLIVSGVALAIMVVVAVALGWLVAGRLLRPLRTMTATARHISANNLHQRLNLDGRDDELHELGATLDDLFRRLEASFESQRHFVANASHEMRTPLTVERTLIQVALADPDATSEDLRSTCQKVLALGRGQERLIDGLLTLANGERGVEHWESLDLAVIAHTAVADRRPEAERRGLRVDTSLTPAPTLGDSSLVQSLVGNLVDNALVHNVTDGRVEISTSTRMGHAIVAVSNTGPPVPPGDVDRLFEPFQRLGHARIGHTDGHGLGLAIVRAISDAHRAVVDGRARPTGGLDVEVTFPTPDARPVVIGSEEPQSRPN